MKGKIWFASTKVKSRDGKVTTPSTEKTLWTGRGVRSLEIDFPLLSLSLSFSFKNSISVWICVCVWVWLWTQQVTVAPCLPPGRVTAPYGFQHGFILCTPPMCGFPAFAPKRKSHRRVAQSFLVFFLLPESLSTSFARKRKPERHENIAENIYPSSCSKAIICT